MARFALVLLVISAGAATACSRSRAIPAAKPSFASTSFGSSTAPERPQAGELHVVVLDEAGAPLPGVAVSGSYLRNPGPVASTCCFPESLGNTETDRNGVAILESPPFTMRPIEVTASRPGWPPRTVALGIGLAERLGTVRDRWGRVVITLGPARDVRGRIDTGPDCPREFIEVMGGPPAVRVPVDGDGRFLLRGLSPGSVSVGFSACGRDAGAIIERASAEPLVLTLPAREAGKWSFDRPPSGSPPIAAPPPAPRALPCLQAGGELVGAGDFDSVLLDARCRFVLAGKSTFVNRYEAFDWTLIRPDGTKVPIGSSVRGSPDIGDSVVYLSVPASETTLEVVNFVRGTREVVSPPAHFVPAVGDAVVLASQAVTAGGTQAHRLEIRWPDGTRRKLPGPALGWSLIRDKTLLVYGVVPGKSSDEDIHLFDFATRTDRVVGKSTSSAYPVDDGRALVLPAADHVTVYDLERQSRDMLEGSGYAWRVFGRDLALKTDQGRNASLRTPKGTFPLAFRWPYGARERRLGDRYLFFGDEGRAVLVDTTTGAAHAIADGVQVSDYSLPPTAGDLIALSEASGRVLIASLSGAPLRAVGRGMPRAFSPDGRFLMIVREVENEIILAPVAGDEKAVTLSGWGGTFAPDAPALFFHTGKGAYNQPRPLFVTYAALGRTVELERRVVSYAVLKGGEVLMVVPPGSKRPAGIYRRVVPTSPP